MDATLCSITLAAGEGKRMPSDMPPKSCCRIGPISVIENALHAYETAGVEQHVVVVGSRADQVMAEVTRTWPSALFAFQDPPRGTGDAVRCALRLLAGVGPPEHVFICAGDKVIAPHVVRALLAAYAARRLDFCLLAGPAADYAASGRLVLRDGALAAIVEVPDIRVRQLAARLAALTGDQFPRTVGGLADLASGYLPSADKLATCFPALAVLLDAPPEKSLSRDDVSAATETVPQGFDLHGGHVSLAEAAGADLANLGVYVGRFDVLRRAVAQIGTDNVQGECYFTDAVDLLVAEGRRIGLHRISDPEDVMAFNTLEELDAVRKVHAVRASERAGYPRAEAMSAQLSRLAPDGAAAQAAKLLAERVGPERPCIVVRSPGRINLMGRHVDHQGGRCNLMAIDRETAMAVSPRDDDRVNLWNLEAANYPPRTFTFRELTGDIVWEDWLRTLDSQYLQRMVSESAGDWVNYIKGAALRLQHAFPDRPLRGMDAFVVGNIPVGAGLSSSSALVVCAAEALTEINALNLRPRELIDLCGEGEWFVGTRGGSGDHAAIKLARQDQVVSVSFFPFEMVGAHPFPADSSLIVCHSGISAKKMENARERFNARVACFHMARELIRERFPAFAPTINHLRDIRVTRLDISLPALYELLRQLPQLLSAREVADLAAKHDTVAKCVAGLDPSAHDFPVRDVALYGLAECERSRMAGALLDAGDVALLGRMMNISHNGDRVSRWAPEQRPFDWRATDERMAGLVAKAAGLVPLRDSGAALWQQTGAYGCSTPEIDLMVDRALACEGVTGAQLAGAGLGGCIMVLARQDRAEDVMAALRRDYYEPQDVEPRMFVCRPSRGSQVIRSLEDVR